MKVGDKVWIYDNNRRIYEKGKTRPIYREHFVKRFIIGETTHSWIVGLTKDWHINLGHKIKKDKPRQIIYTSKKAVEEACWVKENAYKIADKIKLCHDINTLKEIETLLSR